MSQSEVARTVEGIVHQLVDHPEAVQLTEMEDGPVRMLTLRAGGKQAGMIIGRKGRLIGAVRELLGAIGARRGEVIKIEVIAAPVLLLCLLLAAPLAAQEKPTPPAPAAAQEKSAPPSVPPASSAVKPEEAPNPSAEFLAGIERIGRIAAELDRLAQKQRDIEAALRLYREEFQSLQVELNRQVPRGYRWEPQSKSFVKIEVEKPKSEKQEEPK